MAKCCDVACWDGPFLNPVISLPLAAGADHSNTPNRNHDSDIICHHISVRRTLRRFSLGDQAPAERPILLPGTGRQLLRVAATKSRGRTITNRRHGLYTVERRDVWHYGKARNASCVSKQTQYMADVQYLFFLSHSVWQMSLIPHVSASNQCPCCAYTRLHITSKLCLSLIPQL